MSENIYEYLKYVDGKWLTLFDKATNFTYTDEMEAFKAGWELLPDTDNSDDVYVFRRVYVAPEPTDIPPEPEPEPEPEPTPEPEPEPTPVPLPNPQDTVISVSLNTNSVGLYKKLEVTLTLPDVNAVNPQFPYDANPPAGVPTGGVSVDVLFSTDGFATSVVQPAFYFLDYTRGVQSGMEYMYPTGNHTWKVRFAPRKLGSYKFKVRVTDAKGVKYYAPSTDNFTCVASTSKGFIRVSPLDRRYFQFDNGEPFMSEGLNIGSPDAKQFVDATSASFTTMAANGISLARTWITNLSIFGSAWSAWASHHYDYDGYIPGNGITSADAFPSHQFSIKLDMNHRDVFQGFTDNIGVAPNKTYRLMARIKIVGMSGSGTYGFAVKKGGWMAPTDCHTLGKGTVLLGHISSTNGWQEFTSTYTTASNEYMIDKLYATTHNINTGTVFIDEISMREDLGNGQLGPEVLKKPKANSHHYYDEYAARRADLMIEAAENTGTYVKLVLLEKNDTIFGRMLPDGTVMADATSGSNQGDNENFYSAPGLNVRRLHEYYYRYVFARWGYSTAIHSWELINEGNPGSLRHYEATNALATAALTIDSHQHLSSTSNWHSAPVAAFWGNSAYPNVGYGDSHAYIQRNGGSSTSWIRIETGSTNGPITGIDMGSDSAIYVYEHSLDITKKMKVTGTTPKPYMVGEAGIYNPAGNELGNNDSLSDNIWLHQYIWASINPGWIQYWIYWWNTNFTQYNRYAVFKPFAAFMKGIPVNNGNFVDAQVTAPANVFVSGQKDNTNGLAYFWLYDKAYTFTNTGGGSNLNSVKLSLSMPAKAYKIEYWNTWTGAIISTVQVTHGGGIMNLTTPSNVNQKDLAVKIY